MNKQGKIAIKAGLFYGRLFCPIQVLQKEGFKIFFVDYLMLRL